MYGYYREKLNVDQFKGSKQRTCNWKSFTIIVLFFFSDPLYVVSGVTVRNLTPKL